MAVAGDRVRLSLNPLRQCQACLRGEGCGAGVFSRLFSAGRTELWLVADSRLQVGQRVRVGLREREVMAAAGLLYGLPVVAFIVASSLAARVTEQALTQDLAALAAGLLAAGLAVWTAGRLRRRILNPRLEPLSVTHPTSGQTQHP